MADTVVPSANQVLQWEDKYFTEYVRDSLFAPYMGTDENSIIQLNEELGTKAGKTITVSVVMRLQGSGVSGDNQLEDNEESMTTYGHAVQIEQLRNAVRVGAMEQKHTVIDLLDAGRTMLKLWSMDDLRSDIIDALKSPNVDGVTPYASCSEQQKDTWLAAQYVSSSNTRVLAGAVVSNASSEDHSTTLGNVDSTSDKLVFDQLQLGKRLAKKADPHIRPVKVKNGRERYVLFAESYAFRDLKTDTESIHQNAGERGSDNPLFTDPDLDLDGVLVREVPEIATLTGVGNGGIDVSPNFLCGAQAVIVAWGQRPKFASRDFDYGNKKGVAIGEVRGVEKPTYNNIQHAVLTMYSSGVADS
jgi:N4-gp56 family major capsid protein